MKKLLLVITALVLFQLNSTAQKTLNDVKKVEQIQKLLAKDGTIRKGADKNSLNKKDGSPDMRFKANQKKAVGPMKADGTPDLRFKANQKTSPDSKKKN
ncbi:MAG: hypothetical protein EAZ13_10265 [Sphingobacteriia bacterium]|nr:MAG: hypothetical protein EAZ41_09790 [Sphingobacteriia bacterium]TAG31245.1 MAG: hypothetical protein EAZ35_04660 [Sphingobacteriia bacterium]TAH06149.1 MAG: hypothetical protein EAZ13_10265 [Sphingobacteriia bacterium]